MRFDSHFHVIDPRYPTVGDYAPPVFTVDDYRYATSGLRITGGAVVAASFQGDDQAWLLDALERLGPGFVGVAQLRPGTPDEDIRTLDAAGVRALRFTLRRGASLDVELAERAHALVGWHAEVYADGHDLRVLEDRLAALPALSIDHLGHHHAGLPAVLRLVEGGARVKATGFGRVDLDVRAALRAIAAVDPAALMFGTDLPSTRAPRPFDPADLDTVREAAGPAALGDNARAFYLKGQA